jgi:regulator of protease activity HflC (stomatin/prohibitin superfamily)
VDEFFGVLGLIVLFLATVILLFVLGRKLFFRVIIFEYEIGIHFKKGKFHGLLSPGVYWFSYLNSLVEKADKRPALLTVPSQEVLSQANIPVKITLLASYQYVDMEKAFVSEGQAMEKMYALLQLGMRRIASVTSLEDLLQNRKEFTDHIMVEISNDIENLGLQILKLEIKDLVLAGEIKKGFIQMMTARQEGLAALEKARGEMASLRSLANAAKMLDGNPSLYQLRLLQALGQGTGNTLVIGSQGLMDPNKLQSHMPQDMQST